MVRALLQVALAAAFAAVLPGQVSLAELPAVARARAELQRAASEQALGPFWADLGLQYEGNERFLERRIAEAAALGETIVPLLLERLAPARSSAEARQLAANCRRVLERMDMGLFVEALLELVNGGNPTGRAEAILLLGASGSSRAAQVLDGMLAGSTGGERLILVQSLTRLRAAASAPNVMPLLRSVDRREREVAIRFLATVRPAGAVDAAVEAVARENDFQLLELYSAYLGAAAREHEGAARALVRILDTDALNARDTRNLIASLATVAPQGHKPTIERLQQFVEVGEATSLTIEACVALKALGDRSSMEKAFRNLSRQLQEPRRKRDPVLFELRGNLNFAAERWSEAHSDFEKAVEYSDVRSLSRRCLIMMARTEAHRRKWSAVLKNLQAAEAGLADIETLCSQDPAMQEAMQQDALKAWRAGLAR